MTVVAAPPGLDTKPPYPAEAWTFPLHCHCVTLL